MRLPANVRAINQDPADVAVAPTRGVEIKSQLPGPGSKWRIFYESDYEANRARMPASESLPTFLELGLPIVVGVCHPKLIARSHHAGETLLDSGYQVAPKLWDVQGHHVEQTRHDD